MLRQSLLQTINRPARSLVKRKMTRRLPAYLRRHSAGKFLQQTGMIAGNDSKYGTRRRQAISSALPDWSPTAFPEAMESLGSIGLNQSFASNESESPFEQLPEAVVADVQTQAPEQVLREAAGIAGSVKQNSDARTSVVSTKSEIGALLTRRSRIEEMEKSASDFLSAKTPTESVSSEAPSVSEQKPANLLNAIDPAIHSEQSSPAVLFAGTGKDRSPAAWAAKLAGFSGDAQASTRQESLAEAVLLGATRRPAFKQSAGKRLAGAIDKTSDSTGRGSAKVRRFLAPLAESPNTIETGAKFLSVEGDAESPTTRHVGAERNSEGDPPNAEQRVSAPPIKKFVPAAVRAAIEKAEITPSRFFSAVAATSPMGGKPLTIVPDLLSKSELPQLTDFQPTIEPQPESFSDVGLADAVPMTQSDDWPTLSADSHSSSVTSVESPNQWGGEEIDWGGLPAPWEALPDWVASAKGKGDEQEKGEVPTSDALLKQAVADTAPKADWSEMASEAENSFAEVARARAAMMSLTEPVSSQPTFDLDDLAKQVYQRLKRRLAAERRRETS